jgi:predicted RNA-binding Zn ribbon-like protein
MELEILGGHVADWLWDGGRLSVDFLNTLRDRKLGGRETLRDPADLAAWMRTWAPAGSHAEATDDDLVTALRLRDAIDAAAFAVLEGERPRAEDVAVINTTASEVSLAPVLAVDDRGLPQVQADNTVAAALARIAMDAIDFLAGGEVARLRVCAADDCGIRFVDRSPARNRQWCSMSRCGNRSKARRHYARQHDGR